ncbi:Jag N-terminal domain-containing protein [Psychrobacillus psychrodurans]|uniref:Jag N-terminal domain-containing protein n=1 Tax=Psychrobacillus psychrodurans TaxID=126157 RepID=UPI001F4D6DB2|nr:Jag N-terminal domain-containing protein [Psychrobacillus psychrodurans]MCK1997537.1 Jag N-terminal domain-containing protein [Psychrobacillus psychrodurans]
MLQNSINIKAETIEEAVQTALNILKCSIEDINVEVIQSPSKSLFGLRKLPAEVKITRISSDSIARKQLVWKIYHLLRE